MSAALLDEHGTRLREIDGIGPVLAARLLGRTGILFTTPSAAFQPPRRQSAAHRGRNR
jgi:predicted flap endonuclease-1-like 5' DNA nuclease